VWMRSSLVVRASDCQCRSRNSPGFDPSILRRSVIRGAADEAVLNTVHRRKKNQENLPGNFGWNPCTALCRYLVIESKSFPILKGKVASSIVDKYRTTFHTWNIFSEFAH
jgi:hypothetical protein